MIEVPDPGIELVPPRCQEGTRFKIGTFLEEASSSNSILKTVLRKLDEDS